MYYICLRVLVLVQVNTKHITNCTKIVLKFISLIKLTSSTFENDSNFLKIPDLKRDVIWIKAIERVC